LPPFRGGITARLSRLLLELASRGHHIRAADPISPKSQMAAGPDWFAAAHPNIALVRDLGPGYDTAGVHSFGSDKDRRLQKTAVQQCLSAWWRERPFDLVVLSAEFFVWGVPKFCRQRGIAFVVFGAGMIEAVAGGDLTGPVVEDILVLMKRADCVIACARFMGRRFVEFGFERVTAIPNGVDVELFQPGPRDRRLAACLGVRDDDVVFLHASHFHPVKRPRDIIESASLALERNPNLLYLMVGGGSDQLRAELEALCDRRRIADRFRFPGWLPHDQMRDLYQLADVVLMPSQSEGLSNVFLEAQASGRVLLASDIPGAREVVEDGKTGVLFPRGNVAALAEKTLSLAADPALRQGIGRRARNYVARHHRLDDVITGYENVFRGAV